MIRLSHVSKQYAGGHQALSDIELTLAAGRLTLLTGHAGAGKTTLLKLLALLERPSHGRITVAGMDLAHIDRHGLPLYRRKLGMVLHDHRLLQDRPVFDNVALPLMLCGHEPRIIKRRVHSTLDKLGLRHKARQLPPALAAGEQQCVHIARAVINHPRLLLLDEPLRDLEPALAQDILRIFEWLQHSGATLLIATHDPVLIGTRRHPVYTLNDGRLSHPEATDP